MWFDRLLLRRLFVLLSGCLNVLLLGPPFVLLLGWMPYCLLLHRHSPACTCRVLRARVCTRGQPPHYVDRGHWTTFREVCSGQWSNLARTSSLPTVLIVYAGWALNGCRPIQLNEFRAWNGCRAAGQYKLMNFNTIEWCDKVLLINWLNNVTCVQWVYTHGDFDMWQDCECGLTASLQRAHDCIVLLQVPQCHLAEGLFFCR